MDERGRGIFLVKSGIHFGVAEEGLERLLAVRADDGASWVEVARGFRRNLDNPVGLSG